MHHYLAVDRSSALLLMGASRVGLAGHTWCVGLAGHTWCVGLAGHTWCAGLAGHTWCAGLAGHTWPAWLLIWSGVIYLNRKSTLNSVYQQATPFISHSIPRARGSITLYISR